MNITVIYATGRKVRSCTYNIARLLIKELLAGGKLFEFQLSRELPPYLYMTMRLSKSR